MQPVVLHFMIACLAIPAMQRKPWEVMPHPPKQPTERPLPWGPCADPRNRMENLVTREFLQKHIVDARMSLRVRCRTACCCASQLGAALPGDYDGIGQVASAGFHGSSLCCIPHTTALGRRLTASCALCPPPQDIGCFHGYTISTLSRRAKWVLVHSSGTCITTRTGQLDSAALESG